MSNQTAQRDFVISVELSTKHLSGHQGLCTADVLLRIHSHHYSLILAGILDNPVGTSTSLEGQITNAYPHVVMDRIGNGGGKTDPEDRLGHRQRVYVPVASEKFAEHQPTD